MKLWLSHRTICGPCYNLDWTWLEQAGPEVKQQILLWVTDTCNFKSWNRKAVAGGPEVALLFTFKIWVVAVGTLGTQTNAVSVIVATLLALSNVLSNNGPLASLTVLQLLCMWQWLPRASAQLSPLAKLWNSTHGKMNYFFRILWEPTLLCL